METVELAPGRSDASPHPDAYTQEHRMPFALEEIARQQLRSTAHDTSRALKPISVAFPHLAPWLLRSIPTTPRSTPKKHAA